MIYTIESKNLTVTHLKDDVYEVANLFRIPLALTGVDESYWNTLSKFSEFVDEKGSNYRLISVDRRDNIVLVERIA